MELGPEFENLGFRRVLNVEGCGLKFPRPPLFVGDEV